MNTEADHTQQSSAGPDPLAGRTDTDLIAAAGSGHFDQLSAGDIAGTEAVSVREDETLSRAAQLLAEQGISHLVVRDRRRMPVGILSNLDRARAISGRS